ncbi:cytokine receptor-like factor 2 [Pelobates fuscus]|uniref:cytokine receptor-like factor 2 n=1 Tax=Pelobates fuscus TaxID=191477 RepID=UPI002FE4CBAE
MKMRFKSSNTNHWEKPIVSKECMGFIPFYCTFDDINLDPENCYLIELQFFGLRHCFIEDIESVWGPNISLVKGMDSDTCMKNEDIRKDSVSYGFANLLYISSALLLLVIFITSLACATKRLKKHVFPVIPDPKHTFSSLFEVYRGNFQEWTKISGNETKHVQLEFLENEDIIEERCDKQKQMEKEEYFVEDECKEEKHTPEKDYTVLPDIHHIAIEQMKNIMMTSAEPLENDSDICIGNVTYTMNDSMYIML